MLVTINANPASADNYATTYINLLQAIKVVATAGAGTTPSLNALTSATNRSSTNMITVIDNTEAGGWTVGGSDNLPSTGASSPYYNTSFSSPYTLDLYCTGTGSSTYPYHHIVLRNDQDASYGYFSNSFNSYPSFQAYHGATTTTSFSTSDWSGTGAAATKVVYKATPQYNYLQGACYPPDYNSTFTLAVTANYMHLITSNSVLCMGYRDIQAWEANYSDNPPVCSFAVDTRSINYSPYYPASCFMWSRYLNNSGGIGGPVRWGQLTYNNSTSYANPVTGSPTNAGGGDVYTSIGYLRGYMANYSSVSNCSGSIAAPLFLLTSHQYSSGTQMYAPVTDSSTGALVPPAYPIIFGFYHDGAFNPGGKMKGIYKSLSTGGKYTASTFYTSNQTYVVDGENYYPAVLTGAGTYDLFLVRRA